MESGDESPCPGECDMPLWGHVKILDGFGPRYGTNVRFLCDYCSCVFLGSYSTVKAHLLKSPEDGVQGCPGVTFNIFINLCSEVDAAEDSIPHQVRKKRTLSQSWTSGYSDDAPSMGKAIVQAKRRKNTSVQDCYMGCKDNFDAQFARMFYSSGISFNSARDPYFQSSFSFVLKNIVPSYVPPDSKRLKTTLLQKERARIEDLLKPIKSMWRKAGVTIVSDGWSDVQQRPLVNILAVNECGAIFLQAINNEDEVKTKDYIAEKLIAVIEDVGAENVVQVITDNDPVCRAVGLLIEQKYNHIQWMPSIAHTLSLALKNVFSANNTKDVAFKDSYWISEVLEDASMIKNFIMNHTMISSILSEFSKLKILAFANTRFASDLVMLKRFRLIKQSLIKLVISDEWWPAYRDVNMEQAQLVKYKLTDHSWWDQVDYILSFTDPIYSMIRMTDTEEPCLHLINEMWNNMIEKVKAAIYKHESRGPEEESAFYSVVHGILEDWWSKSRTPLQCLAHSLNPRYYCDSWIDQTANRLPPHRDAKISQMRNNCWRKLFSTTDDLRTIKSEYGEFALLGTKYFSLDSRAARDKLDPKMWWVTHGTSAQKIQSLAFKLLSQPVSSSCCERNWRTYDFIRDITRDKLRPEWADDLVFVHTNLRLLSRRSEEYHTDRETRYWDVGDDSFKSLGAGILESANLSLDEPEFELAMIEGIECDEENQMDIKSEA